MFLVDTNIVSEARRGAAPAVRWLRSVDPRAIRLSVVTIAEIARGIALKRARDSTAATHLSQWLQRLRRQHAGRILPITDEVALELGRDAVIPFLLDVLRLGTPAGAGAASALDRADVLGLARLDWTTGALDAAQSRAARALSNRAFVPDTFRPEAPTAEREAEIARLARALLPRPPARK